MSKAKDLGAGASFGHAQAVSARRAAIGAVAAAPTVGVPEPNELPVARISQNPDNPREGLRDLDGLADSIRAIGLVNAITVATAEAYLRERPERADDLEPGTRYIVVDGHRRLAAAKLAGAETVRVSVDNALVSTDEALLEAAFVANVHRDDMNPLEQAQALRKLVEFYGSQSRAAKRLGLAQSTISSKLSVLDLAPELQADLLSGRRKVEHVRNLSKYDAEEQKEMADAREAAAEERRESVRRATELSRRDDRQPEAGGVAGLSRRDSSEESGLSRRDNSEDPELSRRDSSEADAPGLSRRDSPETGTEVPAPRPEHLSGEQPSAPGTRPVVRMPWTDGVACAEIAISRMTPVERGRMLQRLQAEAENEARGAAAAGGTR
ncbi:ParB/RepB/Spo0J family partition protein [Streptomyces melanogenes]|uniref:ParB/RepB/Spo0J family partition protein n=1 Tax=Streptomyces melanogenes TaxID=67326 RepID=UPI0019C85E70|nr:ParB/RepB/Spo0J family partition protein [Streptomyces melanogenes]GGP89443.1 plasmid partitioning protein [Streptomyces melanogenes]